MSDAPKKELSLFDSTCLIVGIIIGVGIYVMAPMIARGVFCWWGVLAIWVVGGLLSLCGALGYAELATAYPREGGDYVYLTRAYGRWAGFLFGWVQLVIVRPGDIAVMAFAFAGYAQTLYDPFAGSVYKYRSPFSDNEVSWILPIYAVAPVVLLTLVNVLGVRQGKWTQNLLTTVKALGLLAIVGVAVVLACGWQSRPVDRPDIEKGPRPPVAANDLYFLGDDGSLAVPAPGVLGNDTDIDGDPLSAKLTSKPPEGETFDLAPDGSLSYTPHTDRGGSVDFQYKAHDGRLDSNEATVFVLLSPEIALALILVLFTFGGWNEMAYVAAEVKNARRNIVRALVLGTAGVTVLYLLIGGAFLYTLGYEGMAASGAVATDTVAKVFPQIGWAIVSVMICISALGVINGQIFTGARISYAMGSEHRVFSALGKWHSRTGTPVPALLAQGAIAITLILLLGSFVDAILYTAPAIYSFYLATSMAVIVLRRKEPQVKRPYRVAGYPFITLIFCALCAFLIYSAVVYKPWIAAGALGILLLGLPVYWLSSRGPANRGP